MRPKQIKSEDSFKQHFAERIALNPELMALFKKQLTLFRINRTSSVLRDHALNWHMQGLRAFSINNDLRVIYEETDTDFIFKDVGTHQQVYRVD